MDPNLVVIRLARTMGNVLYSIKKLILTEVQEALAVASSNFFARSKFFFVCKREEKKPHIVNAHLAEIILRCMYQKNNNYLKCRGKSLRV